MHPTTPPQPPSDKARLEHEWRRWQAEHAERRRRLGYDQPVSDEEALEVLS